MLTFPSPPQRFLATMSSGQFDANEIDSHGEPGMGMRPRTESSLSVGRKDAQSADWYVRNFAAAKRRDVL